MTNGVRLMNATKLAEYLGVSTATLRRLVKGGELPKPVRLPGMKRDLWDGTVIDRYIDNLGSKQPVRTLDDVLFGGKDAA